MPPSKAACLGSATLDGPSSSVNHPNDSLDVDTLVKVRVGRPGLAMETQSDPMSAFARPPLIVLALLAFVGIGPAAPWHDALPGYGTVDSIQSPVIAVEGGPTLVASAPCPAGTHVGTHCEHHGYPPAAPVADAQRQLSPGGMGEVAWFQGRAGGPEPEPPRA